MMLQNSAFDVITFCGSMQGGVDCVRLHHQQSQTSPVRHFRIATRAKTVNLRRDECHSAVANCTVSILGGVCMQAILNERHRSLVSDDTS